MSELAPEGAPVEPVETPVEAEPAYQGPSPEEWQATQERLAQFEQVLQPQQQGPPLPDPFSETYAQDLQAREQALLAPFQQFMEQQNIERGEQQAMEMLGEIATREGEFDKDMAWLMAREIVATRGVPNNDRESQQLLAEAAKQIREYEQRVGEAYHQRMIEQIQTVAGAPRGLPAQVNGAQTVPVGGYGLGPNAVTNRMFGRQ